jgi:hypothetical protein
MKKTALILASIFTLTLTTFGVNGSKNHKRQFSQAEKVSIAFQNKVGFPSELLYGRDQLVVISYSIDDNNIVHINYIKGDNAELNSYIQKSIDGKKMKKMSLEGKSGVVKLYFKGV